MHFLFLTLRLFRDFFLLDFLGSEASETEWDICIFLVACAIDGLFRAEILIVGALVRKELVNLLLILHGLHRFGEEVFAAQIHCGDHSRKIQLFTLVACMGIRRQRALSLLLLLHHVAETLHVVDHLVVALHCT